MGSSNFLKKSIPQGQAKTPQESVHKERSPKEIQQFIDLAMILSEQDKALLTVLEAYQREDSIAFQNAFQEGIDEYFYDEFAEGLECIDIEPLVLYGLVYFGFIGSNDWKSGMDDFLVNSEEAFEHYGLDISIYDSIDEQWEIMAPDSLELIKKGLPDPMGLALWDTQSDEYMMILTKKSTLAQAVPLAEELGIKISVL